MFDKLIQKLKKQGKIKKQKAGIVQIEALLKEAILDLREAKKISHIAERATYLLAYMAMLKASFELGKRQDLEPDLKDFDIKDPQSVVKAIRASIKDKAKEHFKLILLNTRHKVSRISTVSIGTLNSNLVHPREVFKEAISHSTASVVFAHNHPSGDSEPSEDDLTITKRLVEAGKILGIEVLDHIIITKNGFFSFKEKGLI